MVATHQESTIHSADGTALFQQTWTPAETEVRARLLVLHGYMEHGARYREFAHAIAPAGIEVTALDYRGHGRAAGQRGFTDRFDRYHDDVDAAFGRIPDDTPRFLLGHSHGGLISLDWAPHHDDRVRGVILTNPFLALALEVPPLKIWLGNTAARLYPKLSLPGGLPPSGITRVQEIVEAYERDPLVFTTATAGWFAACTEAQARVRAMAEFPLPLFYIFSDSDPVASPEANRDLARQLESPDKIILERTGELHEVLNELEREQLYGAVRDWILERLQ